MKIYLTESQFEQLMEQQILNEGFRELLKKVSIGALSASVAIGMIASLERIGEYQKQQMEQEIAEVAPRDDWKLATDNLIVTVYNATPSQCNKDVQHTASMFKLDLQHPESHKIVALERTMAKRLGLKFGDLVKIEGTYGGKQDGVYRYEDLMNKRFAGMDKADVLVANNVKYGGTLKNQPAKLYVLKDGVDDSGYRADMAPELN